MPVFPGTSERFCDYRGNSTWGQCDSQSYVLAVVFQLAFPGMIVGTILWLCLVVCLISYCCWKCRCPPMPEQRYQFFFGPWLQKGMYKLRLPRLTTAVLAVLTILFALAIVLTDITVYNSTKDFVNGTTSFVQSIIDTIHQYQSQISALSSNLQHTVQDILHGASSFRNNFHTVQTVQLIKWIIEMVVCGFLMFGALTGLVASMWPKRPLFLIVMIISFLSILPAMLLFSYDVAAEGVVKALCSEMKEEEAGNPAALSYGVLPCDNPALVALRSSSEGSTTITGVPALDSLLTCQVVATYSQQNSGSVCNGMMNSGVVGLLSLFAVIISTFLFLVAAGTHGLIGLRQNEKKREKEKDKASKAKSRRAYVERADSRSINSPPSSPRKSVRFGKG